MQAAAILSARWLSLTYLIQFSFHTPLNEKQPANPRVSASSLRHFFIILVSIFRGWGRLVCYIYPILIFYVILSIYFYINICECLPVCIFCEAHVCLMPEKVKRRLLFLLEMKLRMELAACEVYVLISYARARKCTYVWGHASMLYIHYCISNSFNMNIFK